MDEGDSSSDDDYVPSSEGEDVEHDDSEPEASDTKHPDNVGEHNDDFEDTVAPSSSTGRHKSCEPIVWVIIMFLIKSLFWFSSDLLPLPLISSSSGDAGSKEMESEEERKRRIDALFDDFISGSSSSQQQPTSSAVTTDDKDRIDNSIAKPDSVEPTSATDNQLSNQTVTSDVSKDVPSTEESSSC
ncbi:unnamed protein product, partial [Anisakis simplex]|uniref:Ovule protein n=1 Tax=Anisakis simplex TaxID=6269 RepID=A0A0M3J9P5_ANISI